MVKGTDVTCLVYAKISTSNNLVNERLDLTHFRVHSNTGTLIESFHVRVVFVGQTFTNRARTLVTRHKRRFRFSSSVQELELKVNENELDGVPG